MVPRLPVRALAEAAPEGRSLDHDGGYGSPRVSNHGDGGFGQATDDEKTAEQPAQNVGRSVGDKLLVGIDATATLHRSGLGGAERFRIAEHDDGQCPRTQTLQDPHIQVVPLQAGQAGWQVADNADADAFTTAKQFGRERGH
jgi:hypothetical protein